MLAASGSLAPEDVAATLARHGIQEFATPAHEAPGSATVVVASNAANTMREAVDAGVIIGHNLQICDGRTIAAARELRWLGWLSAGSWLASSRAWRGPS